MAAHLQARFAPDRAAGPAAVRRAAPQQVDPSRWSGMAPGAAVTGVAALLVAGLWPLPVIVALGHGSLAAWGAACLATGGWLLVVGLAVNGRRAWSRRAAAARRRDPDLPAARRDLIAMAEAMTVAGGADDWTELVLRVEGGRRSLRATRRNGRTDDLDPWTPAMTSRIDQLDEAMRRRAPGSQVLEVHADRAGIVTLDAR